MQPSLARCCLCLCLSFALAMLGSYGALACPAEGQVAAVVICGSHGSETIYLDADGNRVPDPSTRACGDCVACHPVQAADAAGPLPAAEAPPSGARRASLSLAALSVPAADFTWPAVRGPPTLI